MDALFNIAFAPIDEHGNRVTRTKSEYPYNYDGFVVWRGGKNEEVTGTAYSDRLSQWDDAKTRILMQKHFGDKGDYYYHRKPSKIQSFLRDYFDEPHLKLILVMECCNQASGYPIWRFDYKI